jgi:small conductance mechanosensitive channel
MVKMKRILLPTLFLASLLMGFCTATLYSQEWAPLKLKNLEAKYVEIMAQVETLETYSPDKFPDFKDLDRINQLIEQLDFNKRKFDLLISQYNILEDKLFPYFIQLSQKDPQLRNNLVAKVEEYTGKGERSLLEVQKRINYVALQIERLEKKIEHVQLIERKKDVSDESDDKLKDSKQLLSIASRIQQLEELKKKYNQEIVAAKNKLKELKQDEEKGIEKISEKRTEIFQLKEKNLDTKNPVERLINLAFAEARMIRLNGLEIPRLNTIKTFVYITTNNIKTLEEKIVNIQAEISSLQKRRNRELLYKVIKGLVVIVIALLAVFFIIKISKRISKKILRSIEESETMDSHRKQRYTTLSSVILSFIKILIWVMAVLWILGELEIDYAPFLVAAGGISLAIGFGAQSLVKDVVTGFFLLMEEQFALGDYIEINGTSGTVEKISLRTIKFRSLDGTLHIIPNGSISSVSNKTYVWSRAVAKVGVSYDEKPERVLSVLQSICSEIKTDPKWEDILVDDPVAQGVLSLGDSAILFRILAKTKPGDQWAVERELNSRIKNTFDKEGIEIPYNFMNIVDRTEKK